MVTCSRLLRAWWSADPRQVFSAESSPWLRAVGKLQVPGQRYRNGHSSHYLEDCSATLVSSAAQLRFSIVVLKQSYRGQEQQPKVHVLDLISEIVHSLTRI